MIYIHKVTRPTKYPWLEIEEFEPIVVRNVGRSDSLFGREWFCSPSPRKLDRVNVSARRVSSTWKTVGELDEVSSRSYDVLYNERYDSFKLKRKRDRDFSFDVLST